MESSEKEIFFDHMPTAKELASAYSQLQLKVQEKDPTSVNYKRINNRPKLHLFRVALYLLATVCVLLTLAFGSYALLNSVLWAVLIGVGSLLLVVVLFAKHIAIWLVKVYQNLAPDKVRNRCLFEPSCSNYMILALEKYGFFRGLAKGIGRLMRCTPPNGGIDEP